MHKFIDLENVMTTVDNNHDYDVIIASGAWGDNFLNHFFDTIQRNHKLCIDNVEQRYEYVFYTTKVDYQKYKDKFTVPNITFVFIDDYAHAGGMNGAQIDYAFKRERPLILMAADCLHTPNLIPNLLTKYAHYDVCCVMAQRMFPELKADLIARESEIPYEDIFVPREFMRLCLPHLHRRERRYFMDNYKATGTYGSMFWPMRRDGILIGILVRSFHLGVIYISKPVTGMQGGFLDSNPFLNKLSSPENMGMVSDSDNGFCVDVSFDQNDFGVDNMVVLEDLSQITRCWKGWKGGAVTAINDVNMSVNTVVHSEPLNQEWLDLADKANSFVTHIYEGGIQNKHLDWEMLP